MIAGARFTSDAQCFRCGYLLVGVADDARCPECGLLAEHSRRKTALLVEAHPRWLRQVRLGVLVLLIALLIPPIWSCVWPMVRPAPVRVAVPLSVLRSVGPLGGTVTRLRYPLGWIDALQWPIVAALVFAGVWFVTRPEGYTLRDYLGRGRRRLARWSAAILLVVISEVYVSQLIVPGFGFEMGDWFWGVALLGPAAPLPLCVGLQLRDVAKRADARRWAEHCLIFGSCASTALLLIALLNQAHHLSKMLLTREWILANNGSDLPIVFALPLLLMLYGSMVWLCVGTLMVLTEALRVQQRVWRMT